MDGKIALFDMDGTLFDHDGQMRTDMKKLLSPDETLPEDLHDCQNMPWMKARFNLIRNQPGWWKNLPVLEIGWQILVTCQDIGFCCHILTKGPRSRSAAWAEKVECINLHFGTDFPIDIMGKNKDHRYGRVLVDDYPDYLEGWLKHRPRGLAIMPAHSYNETFAHPNVFRFRGARDMGRLQELLKVAYERKSGQHWLDLLPDGGFIT